MTTVPIFYICYSNIEELNVSYSHKTAKSPISHLANLSISLLKTVNVLDSIEF
jgi:hypothetical protein